jgi:hypothetical protein
MGKIGALLWRETNVVYSNKSLAGECLCMTSISPMRELVYGMLEQDDLMYAFKSRALSFHNSFY